MEQPRWSNQNAAPQVRPMAREDVPQVAQLLAELVAELHMVTADPYLEFDAFPVLETELALEDDLRQPTACAYVAEAGGAVVGMVLGHLVDCFLPYARVGPVGQLTAAYVQPAYRNQRLLAELEARLVSFFREQDLRYLELHVLSSNWIGKAAWRALGYSTFREQMRKRI